MRLHGSDPEIFGIEKEKANDERCQVAMADTNPASLRLLCAALIAGLMLIASFTTAPTIPCDGPRKPCHQSRAITK